MRLLRALPAAFVLGAALLVVPAAAPSPALGLGPLPDCRLDDIMTSPRDNDSWSMTLVDTILRVERTYVPPDLVPVSNAGIVGGGSIRKVAINDLRAMGKAAKANGTPLGNLSSYRSYRQQVKVFNRYANAYGYNQAVKFSARPGHSEHQLGLAIDFMADGGPSPMIGDWATTRTGKWMLNHAWEFGWVLSYPKGKYGATCYTYESWHYRYVGRELAARIHASGLTIREYLWANYTTAEVPTGAPGASASPPTSSPPSPPASATASSSATPSTTASPSSPVSPSPNVVPAMPPASPSGTWFGLDPPVAVAIILLVLASVGLIATLRFRGRARRG
jgi:D-alanyl-D-alanine carboxypeptidase